MMESTGTQQVKPAPMPRRSIFARVLVSKRGRLALRIGCVPAVILGTLLAILALSLLIFFQAPPSIPDPMSYLVGGRLALSLIAVAGFQALASWVLGLAGALIGMRAASGQGAFVRRRLAVLWRRVNIAAWTVVGLRVVLVLVVAVAALYLFTPVLGYHLRWDIADEIANFWPRYIPFLIVVILVCLAQWLVGPLLRLRYSLALGALGGAASQTRDQRPWLALSLRLGMDLAGLLTIAWGGTLLRILLGVIFDPVTYPSIPQYPDFFPLLSPRGGSIATALAFLAAGALIHTALQVTLTWLATSAAGKRQGAPVYQGFYEKAGQFFKGVAKSSVPKGEAALEGQSTD